MSKNNNTIKMNGKLYDALSGELLRGTIEAEAPSTIVEASVEKTPTLSKAVKRPYHKPAPPVTAHQPQTAKTLVRRSVHRPEPAKLSSKHATSKELTVKATASVVPKPSLHKVDSARLRRAQAVKPSKLVSRFNKQTATSYIAPITDRANTATSDLVASLAAPLSAADQLIDKALREATSHLQPAHHLPKKRHLRHLNSVPAAVLTFVLLAAFIGYQNMTNIKLHMASSKAGFAAAMPSYRPDGFSLGKLNYSPGTVAIHFQSNSDTTRTFAITEKPSDWDSQALVSNVLGDNSYQTVNAGKQTIYIYGQNATWISNHVWYQVQNNGALSNQQLSELAGSV